VRARQTIVRTGLQLGCAHPSTAACAPVGLEVRLHGWLAPMTAATSQDA
jgi:hypothetical protein